MSNQFFSRLSQNYIEILDDDEYYDITIEVGEDPNVKIFRAHMIILCYRSPFLRRTISSRNNNNDIIAHIKLPNVSPEIFQIILKDDLQMKEIEIWEHVLKWGLEKNPTLFPDPTTWSDNDFEIMENTLQHYLPLIRFFSLSSDEFIQKVHPYKKLLNHQLYEELLNSYLNSSSEPNDNILLPRYRNIDVIIDSRIVNLNIVSLISRWIDKKDTESKYAYARELYLPYIFKLLLRGSQDGFTPKKFHELCDDKLCTVTFIKIKGTEEIIGGYNPSIWKSSDEYGKTKDSFIFSFKNKDNFKDPILSYIKDTNRALYYHKRFGPTFDSDLLLCVGEKDGLKEYNVFGCKQRSYEKNIRDEEGIFTIEDYEIFQMIKKEDVVSLIG
ncbi:uncharacterized protein OCT59_029125 [Rhizophagus irregularis]|uniref:uncharacterized protein n=1 Tax=Rhizophagus irregularis TaxID=588596 RepID=UPI00331B5C9B|nr:hypothetical protein OCT59_029125 [Rhizophagus irregularis]